VFFLPAAPAAEKDGSLTNTMRLIQWHERAVKPPGDVRSDADFFCALAHRLQKLYAGSKKERDQGFLAANFTYGAKPDEPEMVEVLKEINGVATEDITDKDGKLVYRKGQPLNTFAHLTDDGKTTSGCWIYTGVTVEADGKLVNKAAGRKPADEKDYLAHGWGFAWPANRRILYNRAAADPHGKPWSEKKKLIWWDATAPGQKPEDKGKWVGMDVPDFNAFLAPDAKNGDKPFIMRSDLVGAFFGPLNDGPFPEHYEPMESPVHNAMSKQQNDPAVFLYKDAKDTFAAVDSEFPYVATTYRVTEHEHFVTQNVPYLVEAMPDFFVEVPQELAEKKGITNGGKVKVRSKRGEVVGIAMVTKRIRPLKVAGKTVYQIGIPVHWHFAAGKGSENGSVRAAGAEMANLLTPYVGDANVRTPEFKGFLVDVEKA
jgi:formate dehydrogenase major subunit